MTIRSVIGDTPRRREDARFVTGGGAYLDDLAFDALAHAVLLRSPHAHARIDRIDAAAACAMPGVLAVLTERAALPVEEWPTESGVRLAPSPAATHLSAVATVELPVTTLR